MRPILLLGALLALFVSAASAETITARQWARRADGICRYYNHRFPTEPARAKTFKQRMAFWAKHGTSEIRLDNRFNKQVTAVPLPRDRRKLVRTWRRLNAQQTIWDKRSIAAAWRHHLAAFIVAYRHTINRYNARKPVARALGLKVCTI
jgi:hypothetical protein